MDTPVPVGVIAEPTPRQAKAARHYFGWDQPSAAKLFGIYVGTLRDFEAERYVPKTTTLRSIGAVLSARGVLFARDGTMLLPR